MKTKLFNGTITFAECESLLEDVSCNEITTETVAIWEFACRKYIQQKLYPNLNILETWESTTTIDYLYLRDKLMSGCAPEWTVLSLNFMKEIILSSENIEAMIAIKDLEAKNSIEEEIINLAKKRYFELINIKENTINT